MRAHPGGRSASRTVWFPIVWLAGLPALSHVHTTAADSLYMVRIGNPAQADRLPRQIERAYACGARIIRINPGTYDLPATSGAGAAVFDLAGWRHAVLGAYHVTLIMHAIHSGTCFRLYHCKYITIEGPVISQTRLTFYQGKITRVQRTRAGISCVWRPATGYPFPNIHAGNFPESQFQVTNGKRILFNVVDRRTRRLRAGVPDLWGSMTPVGRRSFRLNFRIPRPEFRVGDWLVSRLGNWPHKVSLHDSRDCTLRDVTVERNGFAPIFEQGGGGNRMIGCRWVSGPKPAGAREKPLVTNEADGLHSYGADPGPDIERCVFRGVFLDDCIAIHGFFQTVVAAAGRNITIRYIRSRPWIDARLRVGEPIQISSKQGFFARARVIAISAKRHQTRVVTLDRRLSVPVGADVTNPDRCGQGYKVIDCRLGDTRARGMNLKGSNGIVVGNTIDGCGMSGISIGPEEIHWHEAGYCHNVIIERNTLIHNGKAGGDNAAVFVHGAVYGWQIPGAGAIGNSRIVVADNTFVSNLAGDIRVDWTRSGIIGGNKLVGPPSPAAPYWILVKHSGKIVIGRNNTVRPGANTRTRG